MFAKTQRHKKSDSPTRDCTDSAGSYPTKRFWWWPGPPGVGDPTWEWPPRPVGFLAGTKLEVVGNVYSSAYAVDREGGWHKLYEYEGPAAAELALTASEAFAYDAYRKATDGPQ